MKIIRGIVLSCFLVKSVNLFALNLEPAFFRNFSLQNGNVYQKSSELQTWVQTQNLRTRAEVDTYPLFAKLKSRNAELTPTNPPVRFAVGEKEFYIKAGSLYVSSSGVEKLLIDRTTLNGYALADFKVSPDGSKVLFAKIFNGSDSMYWSVYDLDTNQVIADASTRVRIYDVSWALDSRGYYYTRWPDLKDEFDLVQNQTERNKGNDVAYHRLGTPTSDDVIVFTNPNKSTNYIVNEVPGQKGLIAYRTKLGFTHKLSMYFGRRTAHGYQWLNLDRSENTLGRFVFATESKAYALTSEVGKNYGIVAYSLVWPYSKKVAVKADKNLVLSQAQRVGDRIVAQYFDKNFRNIIRNYDLRGNLKDQFSMEELGLPGRGALAQALSGSFFSNRVYFSYSAIDKAPVTISYDPTSLEVNVLKNDKEVPFDGNLIASRVYEYRSYDGVSVPIQIYTRKDRAPSFIYLNFYGSNGIVNPSVFNRKLQLMLELGGAVAMVGVRGGGDRGADWYLAGMKNRLSSVADVAWASRWLKQVFPSIQGNVIASGRSYGGMLSYMALTHYPEDFKIVVPVVGIGDLKYYMNDYHGSIGWDDLGFERDADGQIVDNPKKRLEVEKMSPINRIETMKSAPIVLSFTADSDERVGPHQTYLMTHRLQTQFPQQSIFMYEQEKAGHNARSEAVDEATFIAKQLKLTEIWPLK